jgi:hypothetical protein
LNSNRSTPWQLNRGKHGIRGTKAELQSEHEDWPQETKDDEKSAAGCGLSSFAFFRFFRPFKSFSHSLTLAASGFAGSAPICAHPRLNSNGRMPRRLNRGKHGIRGTKSEPQSGHEDWPQETKDQSGEGDPALSP